MANAVNALEILKRPQAWQLASPSLIALVGDEPFLTHHLLLLLRDRLCPDEADRSWAWREFAGEDQLDPRDVFDEAATVPLFAGPTRAAVVRNADAFVTSARPALESLASAARGGRGLVILEVRSFPANTRLAKAVAAHGLQIDTSIPQRYDVAAWVRQWAQLKHGLQLAIATAQRLLERLGNNLGQVDQALARLSASLPPSASSLMTPTIPPEAVDAFAGTPQQRTAWGMIDSAAAGNASEAVSQLAALLDAGEHPVGLSAQAATVLRRFSTAARLLALPVGAGRPVGIEQALREAGVAAWPKALDQARDALLQLGAHRARQLPAALLELDRALKGDASRGLRARLALERLFCKMARQAPVSRVRGHTNSAESRKTSPSH